MSLSSQQFSAQDQYPSVTGRLLFLIIPILLVWITFLLTFRKSIRVCNKYSVITQINLIVNGIFWLITLIGVSMTSIYACAAGVWTIKVWVYFTIIIGINIAGLWLFVLNNLLGLIFTGILSISCVVLNQLLFQLVESMTVSNFHWSDLSINIISLYEGLLLFWSFEIVSRWMTHWWNFGEKIQAVAFWIMAPVVYIVLIVLNITQYEGITKTIGLTFLAGIHLSVSAVATTRYYRKNGFDRYKQLEV